MPAAAGGAAGITFLYLPMTSCRAGSVTASLFRCANPGGGRLAQLAERQFYTLEAGGSNPSPPTTPFTAPFTATDAT
jgi:hypothetical protein